MVTGDCIAIALIASAGSLCNKQMVKNDVVENFDYKKIKLIEEQGRSKW